MNYDNLLTVSELTGLAPDIDLSSFDSPTVSGMISSASRQVSDFLGFSPYAENMTELVEGRVTTEGDLLIFPAKIPVISVSAISLKRGATSISLQLTTGNETKYNIDFTGRNIRYPFEEISLQGVPMFSNFYALRSRQFYVSLSYRAGWEPSDLPRPIKDATVLFLRDFVTNKYNQMGATALRQGAVSFEYGGGAYQESKFIKDAKRLLGPYQQV